MRVDENRLLNKVLLTGDFYELSKYGITEKDFTDGKDAYIFIRDYVDKYGECPTDMALTLEFDKNVFEVEGEVSDNIGYLCKALKRENARNSIYDLFEHQVKDKYKNMDVDKFITWIQGELNNVSNARQQSSSGVTDLSVNGKERKEAYLDVKNNKSNLIIPTPFKKLNDGLGGGWLAGDYVLLEAYTNKGKSWIATDFAVKAWREGYSVLHYSPELSKYNQSQRFDTINGHFNNIAMRNGELYKDNEQRYFQYLDGFTEGKHEAHYYLKTMEDLDYGLTTGLIEADIKSNPDIKFIVVDGFNLMNHGNGRGLRDSMTVTSRKLRQICGKYNVVLLVVHQVSTAGYKESKMSEDEFNADGRPTVNPPDITAYSETIAVIQDACTVLTYDYTKPEDSDQGIGALKVVKTRANNLNDKIDLTVNYNMGYIEEYEEPDIDPSEIF